MQSEMTAAYERSDLGAVLDLRRSARSPWSARGLQQGLVRLNEWRFRPRDCNDDDAEDLGFAAEVELRALERAFIESERQAVAPLLADLPSDAHDFVAWFENLKLVGPGQNDPLFPWLAEAASFEEMKWFLGQEVAGEAGFEDLLALTQVKMPRDAKLEMARNYWDEMGQGNSKAMHGPLLETLARTLELNVPLDDVVVESLALSNLMAGLACNRQYAFHSVGALGVIELTAPGRAKLVNAGLKRLNVAPEARKYFALHATLDVQHSIAWNREVLLPLLSSRPGLARALAEGALMRLRAGERCFGRYRRYMLRSLA